MSSARPKTDTTRVGARLKALRLERRLPVTEVARRMGVTHTRVWHIEAGKYDVTMTTVRRYCDAIGARIHIGLDDQAHTEPNASKEK
jgi:transcriptional regulator with XRE-family HTH domain